MLALQHETQDFNSMKKLLGPEISNEELYSLRTFDMVSQMLNKCGHHEEALPFAKKVAYAMPQEAGAWNNLAAGYINLKQYKNAEACIKYALSQDFSLSETHNNYAVLCEITERHDEALDHFRSAMEFDAFNERLRYFYASALLLRERFEEAWGPYEARFSRGDWFPYAKLLKMPYWRGEDISKESIIVWTELGIGEEVLMASLFKEVAAKAGRLIIFCSPRLEKLFRQSFEPISNVEVYSQGSVFPDYVMQAKYQASFSHVAKLLRNSVGCFQENPETWLKADQTKVQEIRSHYNALFPGKKLVGVSWESLNSDIGDQKSLSPATLPNWLCDDGIQLISLQYGEGAAPMVYRDAANYANGDFADWAAQIAAMDCVVTISTTAAHMAGALGIPSVVLLPKGRAKIWYWGIGRKFSLWYPRSMQLIRQTIAGNWTMPLAEARSFVWGKKGDENATDVA